ncbi:hypothetical protein [Paenisporosarcina indica]|uniref:hypothetical protein n=1 Tax=Paenisporosarcina indica TaxID=650093 RepID=UPI000AC861F6|nr:hypothetical protein [Paenisporosarcina indica]
MQVSTEKNPNSLIVKEDGSVEIPMMQLPKDTSTADMIGLIVYNGKIYTQTSSEIDAEDANALLGVKLGTTKGTIDEWSEQDAYDEEFASTIGKSDIYSVVGYDKDFRIMAYEESDGVDNSVFYESLNGITVNSGEDVLGKLNMVGNVSTAQYRIFSDWDNNMDNYHSISDMNSVNSFIAKLNEAKPFLRGINSEPINDSRNDEDFRELTIRLNDGSKVSLILLKGGYIYYGFVDVYFKVNEDEFSKMWVLLQ